jgi:hypothetical protein
MNFQRNFGIVSPSAVPISIHKRAPASVKNIFVGMNFYPEGYVILWTADCVCYSKDKFETYLNYEKEIEKCEQ